MHIPARLKSLVLTVICAGAIFTGCGGGGSGGSDGAAPNDTNNVFSPAGYEEARSANESLSGVWLMLEEYEQDVESIEYNYDASSDESVLEHHEGRRRGLYVIADTDVSPSGTPRISSCGGTEDLDIYSGRLSFLRGYTSYVADYESNTRITGTSRYSSASDGDYYGYGDTSVLHTGQFTLIKIAALPEDFAVDASSDAPYISYADFIGPIGSIQVSASEANLVGSGPFYGPVARSAPINCFSHSEATYSVTEPSRAYRGTISNFSAGTDSGDADFYIYENHPEGESAYVEIGGNPPDFWFDIDNDDQNDVITGTSSVSVQGTTAITVDASITGSEEGDTHVKVDITLP